MKKYKVLLKGKNFWMRADGQLRQMGFYTTRFVEADTPEVAENLAVKLIREDAKLSKATINEKTDPPMIHTEDIQIVQTFEGIRVPGAGYTFYEEETEENA